MSTLSDAELRERANREKRLVALSSVLAAVGLTAMKLTVGLATNSLGVLSEAAHSGLDLVAAGITFWAVRVSAQPADRDHTYGHGKFENLSALAETLLLLATCVWIVYEAVRRLFFAEEVVVIASIWAFLVIAVSIVVDISRSRALKRVADKYDSQALAADALHFSTDVYSSLVVLFGLGGVVAAQRLNLPWLTKADAVAALGVALIVAWVSLRLGKRSVDDLLDRVPEDLHRRVTDAAASVPGVEKVTLVRVRRSGPEVFADVTLTVEPGAELAGAHEVADRTEDAVRRLLPGADVVVHVEPEPARADDVTAAVRMLAARLRLGAHNVRIYQEGPSRAVELHLEMDESLDLEEAHRQATNFEIELQKVVPDLARVETHLEPRGDGTATRRAEPAGQRDIEAALTEFLQGHQITARPHDVRVKEVSGELEISLHFTLDGATNIAEAHQLTEQLEAHLRRRVPDVGRVVIHVEPQ